MSQAVCLVIDGKTILNGPLEHWQNQPPDQLVELIANARTKHEPWLMGIMQPLADAIIRNQNITIEITTHPHGTGWTIRVDYPHATHTSAHANTNHHNQTP